MTLTRVVELRLAAGLPEAGPDPIPCFGACGGVAGWKDPVLGLYCTLCQGAGKLPYYDQRKIDSDNWARTKEAQAEMAARAYLKREEANAKARKEQADQRRARAYREASVADASRVAR